MNDFRLAMTVTHANGRSTRWGPDEPNGEDIPADLTFSTSIPGGFRDLTCSLLRRIDRTYPDENLFDDVRVYTAGGGSTAWEGRIAQLPRQHGDSFGVTPGAVGWSAHLKDDPSFREIYRDLDMSKWGPASVQRRLNLLGGNKTVFDPVVLSDDASGTPTIQTGWTGNWASNAAPFSEASYASGGIPIERVAYAWKKSNHVGVGPDDWRWDVILSTDDVYTSNNSSGDLQSSGPGSGTLTDAGAGNRMVAMVRLFWNAASANGVAGQQYMLFWTHLAVMGAHGLSLRGTEPDAGYYVSDLINDIVSKAAPMLTRNGIETNTSVVPHAAFTDPVTGEDAISLINAYALWEWGVWEDRDFFYRAPSLDRTLWRARLSNGAKVDLEGDTAEQIFNGVFVTYQDASGQRKTVGPPGATADDTDSALEDTSDSNPVNSHGIPRRWARLDISVPTTLAGATLIGQTYLAERLLASRRGTITLSGTAIHPTKGERPVWEIRAGDSILIEDRTGDVARRVIQTDYRHANREVQLSCDNTSSKLDAILERLGVGLIGRF